MTVLITPEQRAQLLANGVQHSMNEDYDPIPVVKLFTPDAAYTWLIAYFNPDYSEVAWGLCDVGLGHPGTGPVYLSGIAMVRGRLGLRVERDLHFTARKPLSAYARDAQQAGMIVTG